jgi:hypothetical protein
LIRNSRETIDYCAHAQLPSGEPRTDDVRRA